MPQIAAHQNAIKGLATDGARLFSGSADGELAIIEIDSLEPVRLIKAAHDGILNSACAFNGAFATVSRDLTQRLWREDRPPEVVETRHANSIKCVAADPAGRLIASGSYGGGVELYDTGAGAWRGPPVRPTAAGISGLAWDSSAGCFLACAYDGSIFRVHAPEAGEVLTRRVAGQG